MSLFSFRQYDIVYQDKDGSIKNKYVNERELKKIVGKYRVLGARRL